MELKLNNIGIIKNANITLDGLTVIAGENDTGKSTVGKVLYSLIKTINKVANRKGNEPIIGRYRNEYNHYIEDLFKNQIGTEGNITLIYNNVQYNIEIKHNKCSSFEPSKNTFLSNGGVTKPLMIETPFVWSIFPLLQTIRNIEVHQADLSAIDFRVPRTLQDLHFALTTKMKQNDHTLSTNITQIIGGEFRADTIGDVKFYKNEMAVELINTAMGIKYFGIMQLLMDNNHFYDGQILILDEPEVHLHPKWQLELAKIIISLVQGGMYVLVNSHSPYMIEALQRYGKLKSIKSHFYLAENGSISNGEGTLARIFDKLSEPFDTFDELERSILNG
jgi:predicted ATPase